MSKIEWLMAAAASTALLAAHAVLPHEDPQVNAINRLPGRTYSMPLEKAEEAFTADEPTSKWIEVDDVAERRLALPLVR